MLEYLLFTLLYIMIYKNLIWVNNKLKLCSYSLPRNLPTKDPEEAERHRLQYEAMIEAAKKKGTYINQWLLFFFFSSLLEYYQHDIYKIL